MRAAVLVTLTLCGATFAKPPEGTFEKSAGGATVKMTFTKKEMKLAVEVDGSKVIVEGSFGMTKSGTIFGIITKVEQDDTGSAPGEGHLFSFQVEVKDNKLKVSKLNPGSDDSKRILEGEYKKVLPTIKNKEKK